MNHFHPTLHENSRTVLRAGYLCKRSVNNKFRRWNRHFFVLDDHRCLCYYASTSPGKQSRTSSQKNQAQRKSMALSGVHHQTEGSKAVDGTKATLEPAQQTEYDVRLKGIIVLTKESKVVVGHGKWGEQCFEVKTPYICLLLRADEMEARNDWVNSLNAVITEIKLGKHFRNASANQALSERHQVVHQMNSNRNQRAIDQSNKLKQIRKAAQKLKTPEKLKATQSSMKYNTHVIRLGGIFFELDIRYTVKKVIGHGAYGIVISAADELTNESVAIKKITNVFENRLDTKRILREIRLLRLLKHPNISHLVDLMRPAPKAPVMDGVQGSLQKVSDKLERGEVDAFDDIYLVMDEMDTDLQRIIASSQVLTGTHIKFLLFQMLKVLIYLESANVVHRDLKPSNILVNAKCELRVCDFGLARAIKQFQEPQGAADSPDNEMTTYVVTRWYRAPELILASGNYSSLIDVWSIGCIFAELLIREPLFAGDDFLDQLDKIMTVLGSPTEDDLKFVTEGSAVRYVRDMAAKAKKDMKAHLINVAYAKRKAKKGVHKPSQVPTSVTEETKDAEDTNRIADDVKDEDREFLESILTDDAVDLLEKMISFSPDKRISAKQALEHDYLKEYQEYQVLYSEKELDLDEIERMILDEKELRIAVMHEVCCFRPNAYGWNKPTTADDQSLYQS